jgi:[acyl-carrier-protein] S-malonyltransferase
MRRLSATGARFSCVDGVGTGGSDEDLRTACGCAALNRWPVLSLTVVSAPFPKSTPTLLADAIGEAALAFRGYNVTNLGRTRELLGVDAYRSTVIEELNRFGAICADVIKAPVDLLENVERDREYGLDQYAQAVALVVAVEGAQLRLLREHHGVNYRKARLAFGYSLGEMSAVCVSGAIDAEDLVRVPLALARDCAELAHDVKLGILFSRGKAISESHVHRLCVKVTSAGRGTIGMSAVLSPNTYLLVGQGDSVGLLKEAMAEEFARDAHFRLNDHRWPPLHTPIVRQRNVPDRAAVMMETLPCTPFRSRPAVVSLVTGKRSYDESTARDLLRQWVDHPQRLWDAVCETLASDVKTVIHIGPQPNVIPATFTRLSENVRQQTDGRTFGSYRKRALSSMARRPWLAAMLPARAALLRAPFVEQIMLEDWLLDNAPR